jgi:putrescine transport system ATP-binding protein
LSVEDTAAGRLRVAAKPDVASGAMVWVAVRPEKVRITRAPASSALDNCVAGTVVDVGYLGDLSIYKLRIGNGSQLKVASANVGGRGERAAAYGEQVWLSWPAEAAIVLTR